MVVSQCGKAAAGRHVQTAPGRSGRTSATTTGSRGTSRPARGCKHNNATTQRWSVQTTLTVQRCQSAAALRVQTSASRLCLRARRSSGYALERAQSHSEHSEYCEYLKYSVGSDPATTAGQTRPLAVLLIPQHSCALMRYTIPVPHGIGLVLKREMASVRAAVRGNSVDVMRCANNRPASVCCAEA